ncbi:MAG: amidohydrolase family protein [Planctomycetes bacterium]|nr:amidohydrolase family protein [Planctomycetota bacterium]
MPREAPATDIDTSQPPVRRHAGPIIDAHTHLAGVEDARRLFGVAAAYGIHTICGIVRPHDIGPLKAAFGDAFQPIVWVDHAHIREPARFGRENVRAIREARACGAVAAKFWYTPRFLAESRFQFDDPALRPIFEVLAELGMPALVHVADPDCWFRTHYADVALYGTKADQYGPLERTLAAFPDLRVIGAHFGGDPEDFGHLRRLLDAHPNYCIDTSATKWIARELSVKPAESRALVIERADRILFGSDLVVFADATAAHYSSRYWVQRWLWEGEGTRPSPIPDPCATWPERPRVSGLALPPECLDRLYAANACRLLGIPLPAR